MQIAERLVERCRLLAEPRPKAVASGRRNPCHARPPSRVEVSRHEATEGEELAACGPLHIGSRSSTWQIAQGTGLGVIRRLRARPVEPGVIRGVTHHAVRR